MSESFVMYTEKICFVNRTLIFAQLLFCFSIFNNSIEMINVSLYVTSLFPNSNHFLTSLQLFTHLHTVRPSSEASLNVHTLLLYHHSSALYLFSLPSCDSLQFVNQCRNLIQCWHGKRLKQLCVHKPNRQPALPEA